MHSEILIQPFESQFTDQIFSLILSIQREEFGIEITRKDQPDIENIDSFYQRENGNFWVALSQNTVVGTIALKDIGNHQLALRKMFVRADYRGRTHGVAQKLLDTALSWARKRKARDIFLGTTAKFLAAHRFYEKNGFVGIDKSTLSTNFPIMAVDTKFYHFQIG